MADVKWIKITTDMFDNRKIKHLRKLPDGNSIVLIWIMLLTIAGRCNAGGLVFLTENIQYTPKMLADELDFEENTVRLALEALERFGMIQTDGCLSISSWEEYQNVATMDKIKTQNRLRKQQQREREKLLIQEEQTTVAEDVTQCHVTVTEDVTQCHAIDKDIDIEEDIYNINNKESGGNKRRFKPPTLEDVRAYCNERGNNVDAERFIDYYTANGWKVGKNTMRDWRAAVRTWEKNGYSDSKPKVGANGVKLADEQDHTLDGIL